ncbi:MAG: DUF302 domain-containing protein [Dehalococcoidia bacterium]
MNAVLTYRLDAPLAEAEPIVREALKGAGFGILTEVDVTATLRQKLGVETRPYKILGACNPGIAHRALQADPNTGAFLPCGVALYEDAAGKTTIAVQNPDLISTSFGTEGLAEPANEAFGLIEGALQSVATAA